MRDVINRIGQAFLAVFVVFVLFLWTTGILSDLYLMLSVSDDESNALFMKDIEEVRATE